MKYEHNLQMSLRLQDGLVYRYWFYFYPKFVDKRTGIADHELGQKIMRQYYGHVPHGWLLESAENLCVETGMGGLKIKLEDFDIKDHLNKALKSADDIQDFYDDIFDKALMAKLSLKNER